MNENIIYSSLTVVLIMLLIMYKRYGLKDFLTALAGFYAYFAFGPVINFLVGYDIYLGILKHHIPNATIIFFLAVCGIFTVSMLWAPKTVFDQKILQSPQWEMPGLTIIFILFIIYGLYSLINIIEIQGLSKLQRLASAPSFHYQYLLIQMCIQSFYFHIRSSKELSFLFFINLILYIIYCLSYFERDFIFVLVSIFLHKILIDNIKINFNLTILFSIFIIGMMSLAILIASYGRTQDILFNGLIASILNEGSLLFIETRIIDWVEKGLSFRYGETYINSLLNLLPSFILDINPREFYLIYWFKSRYAPQGISGYGFSLSAEAYLNFGYVGVPFVFAVLAVIQRIIIMKIDKHPYFLYLSVFFTSFGMYALRNDSLALMSGVFHASLFFAGIAVVSEVLKPKRKQKRVKVYQP